MSRYNTVIVRVALLLMESLWVYALVALIVGMTVGGNNPSFLGVAAVVFASFGISRGLQNSELSLGILRFWGAALSLIVFYAIVRFDYYGDLQLWDLTFLDRLVQNTGETLSDGAEAVIGVPVLWSFWMRGVLRGQQSLTFEDVLRSFALGVVIVVLAQLYAAIGGGLPREVDFIAIPYLAIGLLAIGLAHTARTADSFERGFDNVWLLVAGGGMLALGLFALLFVVIDFELARQGLAVLGRGVGFVVAGLLYVIIWPILKIVELGFIATRFLIDLWGGTPVEPFQEFPVEPGDEPEPEPSRRAVPEWVESVIRVIVAGGVFAGLLFGTAVLFTRFRRQQGAEEQRESTYQEGRLGSDLGDMLSSFLGRFRGQGRQADGQTEPARRLYFEMLDAAAERGIERRPMETPLELVPRINRAFSGPAPGEITRVFDDVRYGAIAPTADELRRLREEWERLPK